ncbi:MAG: DUF1846 domain-containing protein [Christensenellales bacterium]|jgi:uncharacterized protein (UPF0371 family)
MSKPGFDNEKYRALQSARIRERIDCFGGKLYLEFGGKLFDDFHASRVLPGFAPDSKMRMLASLADQVEILITINAHDIEKNKVRGDLGISYEEDVLRLTDAFRALGLLVSGVVVTRYAGQASADAFLKRIFALGMRGYKHHLIPGYPSDIPHIVSEVGYGKNDYIQTTRPLVVVTAPGPGSGKMAVCLSQLYHDYRRGIRSGYAKFETFPVWNLPLMHPVNLAYEAATADLSDVIMLDPYHLEAYGETAVNYNRDVEIFPLLNAMLQRIQGASPYQSPTDMGVNMVGCCISDEDVVREAAANEILRRYFAASCDRARGTGNDDAVRKLELILNQMGISPDANPMIRASLDKEKATGGPAGAMRLTDGRIVTGKTTDLLGCSSSLLLNALKALGGIDPSLDLISPQVLTPICKLKTEHMGNKNPRLHSDEVLIALCISAVTNPVAELALHQLAKLSGAQAHFSVILSGVDEQQYRKLGVHVSCQPKYEQEKLYHR